MSDNAALRQFLVQEFLPDMVGDDIPAHLDLIENGVIDSLGLLKVIAWIEEKLRVQVRVEDMVPENFVSIDTIETLIYRSRASAPSTG